MDVGVGVGLLMMTLPPVPGDAISSGPHAASARIELPRISERESLVTTIGPSRHFENLDFDANLRSLKGALGLARDSLFAAM